MLEIIIIAEYIQTISEFLHIPKYNISLAITNLQINSYQHEAV